MGYGEVMKKLLLFTDGSVNVRSGSGYGACLAVPEGEHSPDELRAMVKVREFEHTSSTRLELQTLLWALGAVREFEGRVVVYTDSRNIMGLPGRRERFERNDYRSRKNRRLNNYDLYQEFFALTDRLDCEFVKVRGHKPSVQKDEIDELFTLVDRASRRAQREGNRGL